MSNHIIIKEIGGCNLADKFCLNNKNIIKIQSLFRGFICRKKLNLTKDVRENAELGRMVNSLRNSNSKKYLCLSEDNTLKKCILCKTYLSSNEYGCLMEKYIKKKYDIKRPKNSTSGDGIKMVKSLK